MRNTFVLLLGAVVAVGACSKEQGARDTATQPVEVQVEAAAVARVPRSFETGGVVRARTTATLVSRIVAPVQEVLAKPGDRVKAGQVLVRLDARELQANQARAQAAAAAAEQAITAANAARDGSDAGLALAAATHKRIAELRAKNSATPHELDQAVSGLRGAEAQAQGAQVGVRQAQSGAEAAQAALAGARVALSYATISAPFDGVVTEKLVEPGNMAAPGVPLVTIEDARGFRLEVRVDEARAAEVDRTQPVEVVLDSATGGPTPGIPVRGSISEIARALDPGSHAFLVKIDLPQDATLRSGMFGRARFAGPPHEALVVPSSALVRRGQVTSLFVVGSDGRARLRMVSATDAAGGRVEIASGLDAGERVVVAPPPALVDGSAVRAAASPSARLDNDGAARPGVDAGVSR